MKISKLFLLVTLVLSGCDNRSATHPSDIRTAEQLCLNNDGVKKLYPFDGGFSGKVVCNNTAIFYFNETGVIK